MLPQRLLLEGMGLQWTGEAANYVDETGQLMLCTDKIMEFEMAKNTGRGHRVGAVRDRSQTQTASGHWVKRDTATGRFIDVKTSGTSPFKGVRRERPS